MDSGLGALEAPARKSAPVLWPLPDARTHVWHRLFWWTFSKAGRWRRQWIHSHGARAIQLKSLRKIARAYFGESERARLLERFKDTISTGAGLTDYYLLHRYVMERKPRRILELGSGVTTVIMADALRAVSEATGQAGVLETLEDIPLYYEHARSLCPDPLNAFVRYHLSPQKSFRWQGQVLCNTYADLPPGPFDFVFVDGPNAPAGTRPINGTLLEILARQDDHPCDAVIDGRRETVLMLGRLVAPGVFGRDYGLNITGLRNVTGRDLRKGISRPILMPPVDLFSFFNIARPGAI